MSNVVEQLKAKFRDLYAREPARVNAGIVSVVLAAAGIAGVIVSAPALTVIGLVVAFVAPAVVAELTRPKIIPLEVAITAVDQTGAAAFDAGQRLERDRAELSARLDEAVERRVLGQDEPAPDA